MDLKDKKMSKKVVFSQTREGSRVKFCVSPKTWRYA